MLLRRSVFGLVRTYNGLPQAVVDLVDIALFQRALQQMAIHAIDSNRTLEDVCALQCFLPQFLDIPALYASQFHR